MQNDSGAPVDPAPEEEEEEEAGGRPAPSLPDALRNWQVLEVDGEATLVDEQGERNGASGQMAGHGDDTDARTPQIQDRTDDHIVAALETRFVTAEAGTPARFVLGLINNGPRTAHFQAQLEGWIDERWISGGVVQAALSPGDRARLLLEVTPPRQPAVEAGDYPLAVVVRAVEYPGQMARIGAVLTVQPFDAVAMSLSAPADITLTWLRRDAPFAVNVANQGNRAVTLHLDGIDPDRHCRFSFGMLPPVEGSAAVSLPPGQRASIPSRVAMTRFPFLGWQSRRVPVQIVVQTKGGVEPVTRRARMALSVRPIVGPWHMAAAASLLLAAVVGAGVLAVMVVLLAQLEQVAAVPPAAQMAPAAAAPPVIVVNLNQPALAPPVAVGAAVTAGNDGQPSMDPNPALPLILPDQVTAPGSSAPARTAVASPDSPSPVVAGGSNAAGGTLTYGQMFQAVARQYDLDWRMLAAQAYVESGFDAVALSNAGAMGLMQVLPGTWREWAPAVDATDPFDAYSSVQVAAVYLDHLRTRLTAQGYTGPEWMLIAYHWGPEQLNGFLTDGGTWETLPEARRQYVTEILRIAQTLP